MESPFIALTHNVALLLAIALIFDIVEVRSFNIEDGRRNILIGLATGTIGIAIIQSAWVFTPGIVFDTRSMLLCISGLFFGVVPTVVAMTMTAAFRLYEGGSAAWTGVAVIVATGTTGLTFRYFWRRRLAELSLRELYLLGLSAHTAMLLLMFTLPWETALGVLSTISLPVLVLYPVGTVVLGLLIKNRLLRRRTRDLLQKSEQHYRMLAENVSDVIWVLNVKTDRWDYVSPSVQSLLGYTPEEVYKLSLKQFTTEASFRHIERLLSKLDHVAPGSSHLPSSATYEAEQIRKDGTTVWTEVAMHFSWNANEELTIVGVSRDIGERKRSEQALRQQRQQLELVFDGANLGYWDLNLQDGKLGFSERVVHWLGYSNWEVPQTAEGWYELAHPDDRERVERLLLEHLEGKTEYYESEHRLLAKDGTWRCVYDRGKVVEWDRAGNPVRAVGIHQDISQQKQVESELKLAQERFETAFRFHPTAMDMFNIKTSEQIDTNHRYQEVIGFAGEEQTDGVDDRKSIWYDPVQRRQVREMLLATRFVSDFPIQLVTKAGSVRNFLVSARMLDVGDGNTVIASYIDVTERDQAMESYRLLSQAVEQSPTSLIITDLSGNIEYVNPKFCEITGYQVEEVIGKNPRILNSGVHPLEFYKQMWTVIVNNGRWQGEICNRKKDGTLYWESISISGVKDSNGVVTHYIRATEDITEQRRREEELKRQERLAALGHLAAGTAHDFNNIWGVIVVYAQMLSRSEQIPEQLRERARIIHQQARSASDLIQQILDFSRQSNLERHPVNLVILLKEQVKLLKRTLPEHIEILLDYTQDDYSVSADPGRLQQVITNLAINARDAMPHGGQLQFQISKVHLDAKSRLPVLTMPYGDWIKLSTQDTGTGMSKEVLEHVFEPFFTTKERGQGTGLGLAQVYGIIKQHGGYIDTTSEVGIGTTFDIYLPPAPYEAGTQPDSYEVIEVLDGRGQKILLVEDQEALRSVFAELISDHGYTIFTAADGHEAIKVLEQEKGVFDLVISDFIMPRIGGNALLKYIHANYPHLPFIFITGHPLDDDLAQYDALGVREWLYKPIDPNEFINAVARNVATFRSSTEGKLT